MSQVIHPPTPHAEGQPAAAPAVQDGFGVSFAPITFDHHGPGQVWRVAQAHPEAGHAAAPAQAPGTPPHTEAAAGAAHGAGAPAKYLMPHEVPNIATLIEAAANPHLVGHHGVRPHPSQAIELGEFTFTARPPISSIFRVAPGTPVTQKFGIPINPLFSIVTATLIVWVVRRAMRHASVEHPGKFQNFIEAILGGLRNFFLGIMGPVGEKFVPYVGSLWLFILVNNLMGIIPGMKAPTSSFLTTFALGLCTFCYVQYNAIRASGFGGWVYHLLGSPQDVVTWCLAPLFFVLEVIGELVKPVSLSLRLFGNIFGEDKLLASFLGMGMMIVAAIGHTAHPPIGLPLQVIFYPLVLLTSTIQATVFSLLASIYIVLLLPHDHEHEHEEEHGKTGPEVSHPGDSLAAAGQV